MTGDISCFLNSLAGGHAVSRIIDFESARLPGPDSVIASRVEIVFDLLPLIVSNLASSTG